MKMNAPYTEQDLVRIAKRDNNRIRPYLLVNRLQGKHLPVRPSQALSHFHALANKLYQRHSKERLLIIGFAETATAIGAAVACHSPNDLFYLQTTRESIPGVEYIYFSESHSHATEQKLVKKHLEEHLPLVDRIVFVEDEVTTGNTISNIICSLRQEYGAHLKFAIASLLNALPEERFRQFEQDDISCTFLLKIAHTDYTTLLEGYTYEDHLRKLPSPSQNAPLAMCAASGYINTRLGTFSHAYRINCLEMARDLLHNTPSSSIVGRRVLVLGTEEFVYPPLMLAYYLEQEYRCAEVTFHATTRSPILPSAEPDYPFFVRYQLRSLYDETRTTYVYNLRQYDQVFVYHDAHNASLTGLYDLYGALHDSGCKNIQVLQ